MLLLQLRLKLFAKIADLRGDYVLAIAFTRVMAIIVIVILLRRIEVCVWLNRRHDLSRPEMRSRRLLDCLVCLLLLLGIAVEDR